MLNDALSRIGLTSGEIEVYSALLELGPETTGKITKKAGIASSKVYEVLGRLQKKGLANYTIKNGTRYYDATPPERLLDFLDEKKADIEISKEEIKKIIPTIEKIHPEENNTVIYTGLQGPKIALNEILEAGKKGIPNYGFGSGEDPYEKYLPAVLKDYITKASKYTFKTRLLFVAGFKSLNNTAEIRYLPQEYIFPVRTMIYGDKVAIVDFTKPVTTIIIKNSEIANSYKKHFELLWNKAKKK